MKGYLTFFWKEFQNLNSIDILIFSILINLNNFDYFSREIQVLFAIFIIRKSLIAHIHTNSIQIMFFLSGVKTRKLIFLNLIYHHLIYLPIAFLMLFLKFTSIHFFIENLIVFNLAICISALLKFTIPFYKIEEVFLRKMLQTIIYFTFFGLFFYSLKLSLMVILLFYTLIINYFNRTLNYDDIR